MCGIIARAEEFERATRLGNVQWTFEASYNVAPTQAVPVVRITDGVAEGAMLRWGLIPAFARGVSPQYSTINSTVERLETGPAWRDPWRCNQRCVLLCAGFYEWHLTEAGRKQPFFIRLADNEVFGFAGIWDWSVSTNGTAVESCAVITMPANELMRDIHNTGAHPYRMPAILTPDNFDRWLTTGQEEARSLLRPYPAELMTAHAVTSRVNSARNNDPELIQPVRLDSSRHERVPTLLDLFPDTGTE